MTINADTSPAAVSSTLDRLLARHPEHASLISAFGPLCVEQARLLASVRVAQGTASAIHIEPELFAAGKSLYQPEDLPLDAQFLAQAAASMAEAIAAGIPDIADDCCTIAAMGQQSPALLQELARLFLAADTEGLDAWAAANGIAPQAAQFMALQMASLAARRVAIMLPPMPLNTNGTPMWTHGHCPVCGTLPKLSVLHGEEGQRSLVCSLCNHAWRHARTACPFCATDKPDNITLRFVEGTPGERGESCATCKRYILAADLRQRLGDVPDVLPLGMAHLDMLMQEAGFIPGGAPEIPSA